MTADKRYGKERRRKQGCNVCAVLKVYGKQIPKKGCSSIAQSVEHAAVNRSVVGSSPTGGAFLKTEAPWSSG